MQENFIQNRFGYCYYEIKNMSALIYGLYIHPEHRHQGRAMLILKHTINEIREMGYQGKICIEAAPKEDSIPLENLINFYKRLGLKII